MPGEAEGLRVQNADGGEDAADILPESISVESEVEETVNAASAKRRDHE
jgi:hypothetical protein